MDHSYFLAPLGAMTWLDQHWDDVIHVVATPPAGAPTAMPPRDMPVGVWAENWPLNHTISILLIMQLMDCCQAGLVVMREPVHLETEL